MSLQDSFILPQCLHLVISSLVATLMRRLAVRRVIGFRDGDVALFRASTSPRQGVQSKSKKQHHCFHPLWTVCSVLPFLCPSPMRVLVTNGLVYSPSRFQLSRPLLYTRHTALRT